LTMANQQAINAFSAALGRIGINLVTRVAISDNGFTTILNFDKLPKHLEAWQNPVAAANQQVHIPFVSLKKLKAMHYWVIAQCCMGIQNPCAQDFNEDILKATIARMKDDKDCKAAMKDMEIQKPDKLADLGKWTRFWELLSMYLSRVKGTALILLIYLVCEHEEVMPEMQNTDYGSVQEWLIATMALSGPHFELDNRMLYDKLKPLVIDGPGWSFIKKYDKKEQGRKAVLALKMQAEGTSAKISRKAAVYASITSSSYNKPHKGFTFSSYITLHQVAHNKLLDLNEPVSQTKKVTNFLKGIRDPNLTTGKSIVLGDPAKLEDFEMCQQYLSAIIMNLGNQAKAERHIAVVHTGGGGGGSLVNKIKQERILH
jgi:hypothetical protein